MRCFRFEAADQAATRRFAEALADSLPPASVVALCGTLGAGKTFVVQHLAARMGVPPGSVTSPTFILINEYQGQRPIYHFDVYRIRDDDEFLALGPEEYFDSPGITLIEWADRVARCLPSQYLEVHIDVVGETARRLTCTAHGPRYEPVVAALAARLGA
jgi:tRNA threonylcarbamoyladenosine biosynthesis protein TsaE